MGTFQIKTTEQIQNENGKCVLDSNSCKNVYFNEKSNENFTQVSEEEQNKTLDEILKEIENDSFKMKVDLI